MKQTAGLCLAFALSAFAAATAAQEVAATVGRVNVAPLPRGQLVIDIATVTRHPAYLEPQSLKTPEGVHILASAASPDNVRTCPRGAASGSECRQVVRVQIDSGNRCHAGGDYAAVFSISCWPGTAASLCKPGAYPFNFKLGNESTCPSP